jgi:hypothetical protein
VPRLDRRDHLLDAADVKPDTARFWDVYQPLAGHPGQLG